MAPAYDILKYDRHPLNAIFAPQSVAVIGASEKPGSVGRTILWNLISSPFGGTLYPVSAFPMSPDDWRQHFGSAWTRLREAKRRYDPHNLLTPAYNVI